MEVYGTDRHKQESLSTDRLSELPDEILSHILSLLPTKISAATPILGRRWRYLWAYLPNLHFDCEESRRIIDRVLVLHKQPSLKSFSIQFREYECDEYRMETWINFAIDRNVQYLHLSVNYYNLLPCRLFTCETLVDLRLCGCGDIPTLEGVCLPRLKNLWLMYVEFEDDKSLPCLLSGSPVLQYFQFRSQDEISLSSCYVSSPTVKWLCLETLVPSLGPRTQGHKIVINTPALEYLSVFDNVAGPIEFGDLPSLIAAHIYNQDDAEGDEIIGCVSLLKCVDSLSNVKCLKLDLSFYTTIIKSLFSAWTPSFMNLIKLELTADCCLLSKFLENANNLEILEFHDQTDYQINSEHPLDELTIGWIEPQQVPKCLLSSLKTIKIVNTVGTKHGLEIIRYLLWHAKVLKRMHITYPPCIDSEEKNNLLQKISLFERGSMTCELVFTEVSSEDCDSDWEGIPLGINPLKKL